MSFDQFSKTLKRQISTKKAKSLDSAKDDITGQGETDPLIPNSQPIAQGKGQLTLEYRPRPSPVGSLYSI